MREAAAALRMLDEMLRALDPFASEDTRRRAATALFPACDDAIELLGRVAGFIHWKCAVVAEHLLLLQGLPAMVVTGEPIARPQRTWS